jgi:hypothetical protein
MSEVKMIEGFRCLECGAIYYDSPDFDYCDNTIECATAWKDGLEPYSWVATEDDLKNIASW